MTNRYALRLTHSTAMVRTRISELYLAGKQQAEIGVIAGEEFRIDKQPMSQAAISKHLKAIRLEWRTQRAELIDKKIDLELARIDQVEKEAWEGWKRSIGKIKTTRSKSGSGPNGAVSEDVETIEHQAGDPRFLSVIQDCVKKRCEILGLNAAQKIGNPDGSPLLAGIKVIEVGN